MQWCHACVPGLAARPSRGDEHGEGETMDIQEGCSTPQGERPRRLRRLSKVLRLTGALTILAGALVLADRVALAVHDIGVFELEGDAVNDPAVLGDDWDTV